LNKRVSIGTSVIAVLFFFWSCSTQKNKMVNRSYHSLTTTFNVLFNGEEAFDVGASILSQVHDDNFFEVLEVEPIVVNGERMDQTTIVPWIRSCRGKSGESHSKTLHEYQWSSAQQQN
jgi:hypothetical protein